MTTATTPAKLARWILVGFILSVLISPAQANLSLDRFEPFEIKLSRSLVKTLDPFITQRKKTGTAPLITFPELYAQLSPEQKSFMEHFRQLNPLELGGSNRPLPQPTGQEQFIRLDRQAILKEGKPFRVDTQFLPQPVYEAYQKMMAAMEANLGKRLLVESGYRSPAYQAYLFLFYLPKHDFSVRETSRHVALPGFSEHGSPAHQAIDFINAQGINGEDRPAEFEELQEFGWLAARAREFGFYLSYPKDGPSAYEPWHWHWEGN